ncbi:MAG: PepSY domain-containing protein [Rhodobacteraceae bacterium]|nr:PepSY domain-containing protein [Paracoccaceae bacterium]
MKHKKILSLATGTLISLGLLGGAATMAVAEKHDSSDKAEVQAFMATTGSLTDAVTAAEKQMGGKAMSVEFDNENGAPVYEVELAKTDGTTQTFLVNPANGKVVKKADENEDNDKNGEENESN